MLPPSALLPAASHPLSGPRQTTSACHAGTDSARRGNLFFAPQAVGLHAGWAVEGVVGSIFKTDATFLSSHADLPAKLAIAAERTKAGVIMSSDFSVSGLDFAAWAVRA